MKLEINENREIVLKEVFSGVLLETTDGEYMGICMRDTGFEFNYNGDWYSAQNGRIKEIESDDRVEIGDAKIPQTSSPV